MSSSRSPIRILLDTTSTILGHQASGHHSALRDVAVNTIEQDRHG
jgi:hypothetical protein